MDEQFKNIEQTFTSFEELLDEHQVYHPSIFKWLSKMAHRMTIYIEYDLVNISST
jgi:predicted glycoside hydrolase/deacetylase ChbG (UPF0249 family)